MKPIVEIENISKYYELGKSSNGTLREMLSSFPPYKKDIFKALDDVSFNVNQGESLAIIGSNGAGKSTLLKILSKITKPTKGQITMEGRVTSLLEVGTGFHPELTGRENIFLNGSILGMSKQEIRLKFDEIVAFSGVERFLDTPVKHYSSGMYVRLAFAVAAHLDSEILIIDEVLAVGDADFQKKCLGTMKQSEKQGKTIVFVSHSFAAIRQLCSKGIWLDHGTKKFEGEINECIDAYSKKFRSQIDTTQNSDQKFHVGDVFIVNEDNKALQSFTNSSQINLILNFYSELETHPDTVQFKIVDNLGQIVFVSNQFDKVKHELQTGWNTLTMFIPPYMFNSGTYSVFLGAGYHGVKWLFREMKVHEFEVHFSPMNTDYSINMQRQGIIAPMLDWKVTQGKTDLHQL